MTTDFERPRWNRISDTHALQLMNPEYIDYQTLEALFNNVVGCPYFLVQGL